MACCPWARGQWSSLTFYWNYFLFGIFQGLLPACWLFFQSLLRPFSHNNMRHGRDAAYVLKVPFGINYEVRNKERMPETGPYIIIANHQSAFDVPSMTNVWPLRCVVLAKASLVYSGIFGLALWLSGNLFVKRSDRKSAIGVLDDAVEKIKKHSIRVWVFPEGTRHDKEELLPFKKGAFHMAVQAQVPIVPLVCSSYRNFLDTSGRSMLSNRGGREVIIEVLEPISTEGTTKDDVDSLLQTAYDRMNLCFKKVSQEAQAKTDALLNIDTHSKKFTRNSAQRLKVN